jgi:hypothetical protein
MNKDAARELAQLLEEKEMLRALERGPEARLKWLNRQRDQVAALLAEIETEIEKANAL